MGLELDQVDRVGEVGDVEAADSYFDLLDALRLPDIADGRARVWSRAEFAAARETWPTRIAPGSVDAYYREAEDVLREYDETVIIEPVTFRNLLDRVIESQATSGRRSAADESNPNEVAEIQWPPGRNQPCWCGSERKYKKCCGTGEPAGQPQAWGPAGLRAGAEVAVGRV